MTQLYTKPLYNKDQKEIDQLWQDYFATKGEKQKTALLTKYAYLVRYVLGRMKVSLVPHLDRDDLESVGTLSLVQCFDKFDPSRGVKFETYAYRRIQGGILDYLRQIDCLSRTTRERINKFKHSYENLKEKLKRNPFEDELMQDMGIDLSELKQVYFGLSYENPVSLEASQKPDADSSDETWGDPQCEDKKDLAILDQLVKKETVSVLAKVISELPEKERILISLYYYEELTFREIGEIFNLSESRICQMHGKALMDIESILRDYV